MRDVLKVAPCGVAVDGLGSSDSLQEQSTLFARVGVKLPEDKVRIVHGLNTFEEVHCL